MLPVFTLDEPSAYPHFSSFAHRYRSRVSFCETFLRVFNVLHKIALFPKK